MEKKTEQFWYIQIKIYKVISQNTEQFVYITKKWNHVLFIQNMKNLVIDPIKHGQESAQNG